MCSEWSRSKAMWSLITLMLTAMTPHTRHTRPIPGRYPALKLGLQTEKSADFEKVTTSLVPRSDAHGPKAHGSVLYVTATSPRRGLATVCAEAPLVDHETPQKYVFCVILALSALQARISRKPWPNRPKPALPSRNKRGTQS